MVYNVLSKSEKVQHVTLMHATSPRGEALHKSTAENYRLPAVVAMLSLSVLLLKFQCVIFTARHDFTQMIIAYSEVVCILKLPS